MRAPIAGFVAALAAGAALFVHPREQSPPAGNGLTVPPGFDVERVAGPPLVNRPIVADFDEQGRLYVADSSGSNDKVEVQLAEKPHRIVRLEDKDGDGRYDASTVFADRMMFPEGAMWFDGSLYVAAPPSIWKLTDTDGDGVADRREEWFQGKTLTGCANDLHGPYLGPDGWIYWAKGAFAEQRYDRPGKPPLVTRAAHIFRRRPGDATVEPVMTGGMDNPVDVAFTPAGERIFTATFLEHPQLGRRDALIHAVYGGVYGKPHAVIDGHPRTGDLMPALTHFGPAAPAGLTSYASRVFGDGYRDNFFAALFNLHKVTRHALVADGATFKSQDSDFLVSSSPDFHPTDVLEDADGSLLVIDTGAWYKLCCPSSQLAKPEVLGAIYRVRRTGAPGVKDPRGLALAWDTMTPSNLAALLDDPRPAVRKRAIERLAKGGDAVLAETVTRSTSVEARRNAVWALTGIDGEPARAAVRRAVNDADDSVRQAALHSVAVRRDAGALTLALDALKSRRPAIQRVAAEALGRLGDARAVPDLLAASDASIDRALEHSLTFALIEIANPAATSAGLQSTSSRVRRAALVALDQMDGGGLKPASITALLDSADSTMKDTAWWIAGHHPEWGDAMAQYFTGRLNAGVAAGERELFQQRLAQFGQSAAVQALLATAVDGGAPRPTRAIALSAMALARPKTLPPAWSEALVRALADRDADQIRRAVAVVRASPPADADAPPLTGALLAVARDKAVDDGVRLDALAAIQASLPALDPDLFAFARSSLEPAKPASIRLGACAVLEKARLSTEQLRLLADALTAAGPLELPRLLAAFDNGGDEAVGLAMIAAVRQSKGRSAVRGDAMRARVAKYPATVQKQADALLASLDADTAGQARHLQDLLTGLQGGDVRRGQLVFNSPKAACVSCHAIGYLGGRIGPDLTRIGQIRSERDLLEAVVYPSASFARSYEPVVVSTSAGRTYSGVLRSERPDEIVLVTSANEEVRILRQDIEEIEPGTVSLMPTGFADQLTRQELSDLIAFLKATRSGAD